jgi:hypothetical protein
LRGNAAPYVNCWCDAPLKTGALIASLFLKRIERLLATNSKDSNGSYAGKCELLRASLRTCAPRTIRGGREHDDTPNDA